MPNTPFLESIMTEEAQKVIGQPHEGSKGALHILLNEGFELIPYVHPFDAGPIIKAKTTALSTVANTKMLQIKIKNPDHSSLCFLSNPNLPFEVRLEKIQIENDSNLCVIAPEVAVKLQVDDGQMLYVSPFHHHLNTQHH